jgi:maleylpyruvate isomerase
MPLGAWARPVRWMSGKQRPASRAADSRLTEVLVHVDLRPGFGPACWPGDFVTGNLADVVAAFAGRDGVPGLHPVASDTGAHYRLGAQHNPHVVEGPQASLLVWLLGRSDGSDLGAPQRRLPFLH